MGGLEELGERVRADLALLSYPSRSGVSPRKTPSGAPIIDVLIVGENALDRAGPWLNFARMRTLRTPKYLTGPDLGIPSLTPRSWYEAQHGEGSWENLGLIPKDTWAEYL